MATDRTGRRYGVDLELSGQLGPRFFARPIAFDCECPNCGRLLLVGYKRRDNAQFNRVTSELHCPTCRRKFLLGLVAWNVGNSNKRQRPADQRPTPDQLSELRQAARGVWASRTKKQRGAALNLVLEDDHETEG